MKRNIGIIGLVCASGLLISGVSHSTKWLTGQTDRPEISGSVSVLKFGAVGDGTTDDTAAIQAAIDAGEEIHFPEVPAFYRVIGSLKVGGTNQQGGKRLIGHRPCRGGGALGGKPALIQGDGSATLFQGVGSTKQNRAIEIIGISALNTGFPILELASGIDGMVDNCWFRSLKNKDATIKLRESYNVTIRESTIGCSGGGFAITAYQQCNKLRVQNCRLYGGDVGGSLHVEQSSCVQIEGNLIELGVYGIVVSSGIRLDQPQAGNVVGAGVCHALRVTGNYLENVQHPIVIASALNLEKHPGQAVFAAVIESNSFGSYGHDNPIMVVGRLGSSAIRGNSFWRKADGRAPAIYVTGTTLGNPGHPTNCVIEANQLTNGRGPFIDTDDMKFGAVPLSQKLRSENKILHQQ